MDAKQQLASTHKESWGQVGGAELTPKLVQGKQW
jgi:hypothetical protein